MENLRTRSSICILTSAHPAFDTRIFHKQAKTLSKAGYEVILIAQHDKDEVVDGIKIVALPKPRNRFWRMLGTWCVFGLALRQKADIYHFHDPELLPVGILLKILTEAKIVYDIHENIKEQILTKHWLQHGTRKPISWLYQSIEKIGLRFMDRIIIAEDSYIKNYAGLAKIQSVKNYPALPPCKMSIEEKKPRPTLVYVGSISVGRGILEMISSIKLLKAKYENILLALVGPVDQDSLKVKIHGSLEQSLIQGNVRLMGSINNKEIYNMLSDCHIGMAILHPEPNYVESLPTKLFEYMAAGLPVIASNFPLWQEIIEDNHCGLTVDPLDPQEIARAIEYLIEHPDEARKMGENGRKAALEKYNWEKESKKLLALYEDVLKRR